TFVASTNNPWITQASSYRYTADFTGDGRVDFVYCTGAQWYIAHSTGTGFTSNGSNGISCSQDIKTPADFNKDGRSDLMNGASAVTVYRSHGRTFNTNFDIGWTWNPNFTSFPGNFNLSAADMNGDGAQDLVSLTNNAGNGYFWVNITVPTPSNQSSGGIAGSGAQWGPSFLPFPTWHRIMDITGDGKVDLLFKSSDSKLRVWVTNATGSGFVDTNPTCCVWLDPFPTASDNLWRFGDFNGDSLLDFLILSAATPRQATVYLNSGTGFQAGTQWLNLSGSWDTTNPDLVQVGDFNGDGMTDLVNHQNTYWDVRLSTGKSFGLAGTENWGTAGSLTNIKLFWEDFNGDGKTDRGEYNTSTGTFNVYFSEAPVGGPAIHLVKTLKNSLGGSTTNIYKPSPSSTDNNPTPYVNKDAVTGTPNDYYLPFIVQMVNTATICDKYNTSTSTCDGNSSSTTYAYKYGKYDPASREFWGFNQVTVTDPTGAYTRTTFLQSDQLKGKPSLIETYNSSNYIFAKTVNDWTYINLYTGVDFPFLRQVDNYSYVGDGTTNSKQAQIVYRYDCQDTPSSCYGNLIKTSNMGEFSPSGDERYDYIEYVPNTPAYVVGLPSRVYTYSQDGVPSSMVAETKNYYDGAASHTTFPQIGDLTKTCQWYDKGTDPCTQNQYDIYGNRTRTINARGVVTSVTYDTTYQAYPVTETNPLNHTVTKSYDSLMRLTSVTDPNNVITTFEYDTLHRITKEVVPPDSTTNPTKIYIYDNPPTLRDGIAPEGTLVKKREVNGQSGTLDSYTFVDGLGRTIQTKTEAPETPTPNQQIVVDTTYNSRGLVDKVSVPYQIAATTDYSTPNPTVKKMTTEYNDPLRRMTKVINTDNTYTTYSYDKWTTAIIDANGHKKVETRDAYGRLIKVEEFTGTAPSFTLYATTTYAYGILGNLLSITDALGNVTTMTYDSLGQKIFMHDPDMGNWTYEYDAVGNLTKQTDAKGQNIYFSYDPLNRVTEKSIR
ncbi:MAG: FG-GAP-like repeat-containing protein, partial [Nitrospira sp.]|nr:FG-GAP-like repeat-containing protein [Nitrospira sp.]